ncbi:hypothetical protein CLOSTASPAR_04112 [[Clostridium] asparagiforme DSM 15981]|uniref:Uncharacterized protein n=1 Tax=[Clostridium] asparagiforme DSM 15981 TaxID=518636 RepID=C0D4B8_9FIRM|nr:hypothetical protein CLOSTASPAR_04112 [[Clostridium] asparagiforme DSM 15981]
MLFLLRKYFLKSFFCDFILSQDECLSSVLHYIIKNIFLNSFFVHIFHMIPNKY